MKPNDKAYEAAVAEGKLWKDSVERKVNQIPYWKVLRQADDKRYGYGVIAKFNNHKDRDEALERLRAEAMVDAAFAAQFQSEDYAGLVERLKNLACELASVNDAIGEKFVEINEAADALEAVLAERNWWQNKQEETAKILGLAIDAILNRPTPVDGVRCLTPDEQDILSKVIRRAKEEEDEARHLTAEEQKVFHSALRRSAKIKKPVDDEALVEIALEKI